MYVRTHHPHFRLEDLDLRLSLTPVSPTPPRYPLARDIECKEEKGEKIAFQHAEWECFIYRPRMT